jgi:hypothetical protein
MSSLSIAAIGLIMLVLFGTFYWLTIFATLRAILAFAGICCIGLNGFVGHVFGHIATWAAHLSSVVSVALFGAAAVGALIITIPLVVVFIHDLHPKKTAGKRTGWAGIALAIILVAGVSGIQAANNIPSQVRTGVTSAKTGLGG